MDNSVIAKSGWLFKKADDGRWEKNWIELYRDGYLKYYESDHSPNAEDTLFMPTDCTDIKTGGQVEGSASLSLPPRHVSSCLFSVVTSTKTWIFIARCLDDMRSWQLALEQGRLLVPQPNRRSMSMPFAPGMLPPHLMGGYPHMASYYGRPFPMPYPNPYSYGSPGGYPFYDPYLMYGPHHHPPPLDLSTYMPFMQPVMPFVPPPAPLNHHQHHQQHQQLINQQQQHPPRSSSSSPVSSPPLAIEASNSGPSNAPAAVAADSTTSPLSRSSSMHTTSSVPSSTASGSVPSPMVNPSILTHRVPMMAAPAPCPMPTVGARMPIAPMPMPMSTPTGNDARDMGDTDPARVTSASVPHSPEGREVIPGMMPHPPMGPMMWGPAAPYFWW